MEFKAVLYDERQPLDMMYLVIPQGHDRIEKLVPIFLFLVNGNHPIQMFPHIEKMK